MSRHEWVGGTKIESWVAGITASLFGAFSAMGFAAGATFVGVQTGIVAVILALVSSASKRAGDRVRFQPRALALLDEAPSTTDTRSRETEALADK